MTSHGYPTVTDTWGQKPIGQPGLNPTRHGARTLLLRPKKPRRHGEWDDGCSSCLPRVSIDASHATSCLGSYGRGYRVDSISAGVPSPDGLFTLAIRHRTSSSSSRRSSIAHHLHPSRAQTQHPLATMGKGKKPVSTKASSASTAAKKHVGD
jgi:hypothetical protein